jgi:thiamine biosynthesis lipoprotein
MRFPPRRFLNSARLFQRSSPRPLRFEVTEPCRDIALLRVWRRAMATTFEIALPYGTPDGLAAAEDALDQIDALESQLTVYRADSDVSELNRRASREPVPVESGLFSLLQLAAAISQETAGAFDVATGALIKCWGFFQRTPRLPQPELLAQARAVSGMKHVILDAQERSIKYRRFGLELNLGSIGKGYALDRAAEHLRQRWGIRSALLHAGGSSVVAIGSPPGIPRGWGVSIRHPWDQTKTLGMVWLRNCALGTSAATFQFFEQDGRKYGHLLDPRTGWPATGSASASVIAPSAAEADAFSTAYFVLGPTPARNDCQSRPDFAAVLLPDTPGAAPGPVNLGPDRYDPPGVREQIPEFVSLFDG